MTAGGSLGLVGDPLGDSQGIWQVCVGRRSVAYDAAGRRALAAARSAGYDAVDAIDAQRIYLLEGELGALEVARLCDEVLADPVTDAYAFCRGPRWPDDEACVIDVYRLAGVTDPAGESTLSVVNEVLGTSPRLRRSRVRQVRTAWRYRVGGMDDWAALSRLAADVLANDAVEKAYIRCTGRSDTLPPGFPSPVVAPFELHSVAVCGADDTRLTEIAERGRLFLSTAEMCAIRDHFESLGRDPTDLELETIAQTWSEHCVHKTIRSRVVYEGAPFGLDADSGAVIRRSYGDLLGDTVMAATRALDRDWCWSVFSDNAGIIAFDETDGIAVKVETHNHPSAIEPYGGAATGMGGCIRDILGAGLGAKPIAGMDVFCVGRPDYDSERLPPGVLRPARVLSGVVAGVRDYGNRMGIPTVAGALVLDDRYLANPLVFCGCVGRIPRDRIGKSPQAGDAIVLIGGRTGRDGIGGATFSSGELTEQHADVFAHAVQIGHPIEEKKVADALLAARDDATGCLYNAVTDCGAGGLSSAVGEMAEGLGAVVDLECVPLKYAGLLYNEIWLSEAQERMVLSVSPAKVDRLIAVCAAEEVEASVIGRFTDDGELVVRHSGKQVGRLSLDFLHDGRPGSVLEARWMPGGRRSDAVDARSRVDGGPKVDDRRSAGDGDAGDGLLASLGSPNVCSRRAIWSQYDHEVQGRTVTRPGVGTGEGPSDAAVILPKLDGDRGVAIGMGLCPSGADDDPYWMAVLAIDEALRNVISVGADPDRVAILDNFCWPGCDTPEAMGSLVRACQGCHDAAVAYGLPFVCGKDSLNNQFSLPAAVRQWFGGADTLRIPATLLITAVGIVEDVSRRVTTDVKSPGNGLVLARIDVRRAGLDQAAAFHRAVARFVQSGDVVSCHDISDGGFGAAVAEMCIGSTLGADLVVDDLGDGSPGAVLLDETGCGYVLEVSDRSVAGGMVNGSAGRWPGRWRMVGRVVDHPRLTVRYRGRRVVDMAVSRLADAWDGGLNPAW